MADMAYRHQNRSTGPLRAEKWHAIPMGYATFRTIDLRAIYMAHTLPMALLPVLCPIVRVGEIEPLLSFALSVQLCCSILQKCSKKDSTHMYR